MSSPADDPEALIRELIALEMAQQQQQQRAAAGKSGSYPPEWNNSRAAPSQLLAGAADAAAAVVERDDAELVEMKAWIASLPPDGAELLRSMEFDFRPSTMTGGGGADVINIGGGGRGHQQQHEADLLREMLELQPPPPTPIHPRAVPYKSTSSAGATDGRDEEDRVRTERFRRPRMFQLVERSSAGCGDGGIGGISGGWDMPHRRRGGARNNGGGGGGRLLRQQQRQQQMPKKFDVVARKFVTPWGDVLSVGTTAEQREADDTLLRRTGVRSILDGPGPGSGGGAVAASATHRGPERKCHLCPSSSSLSSLSSPSRAADKDKDEVLRMLRVSSRGRFLSTAQPAIPSGAASNGSRRRRNGAAAATPPPGLALPFCAPWFDPTVEWFSLSTYLASRYEAALWDAFRSRKEREKASSAQEGEGEGGDDDGHSGCVVSFSGEIPASPSPPPSPSPMERILRDVSEKEIERALQGALRRAVSSVLRGEDASSAGRLRDGILWKLLHSTTLRKCVESGWIATLSPSIGTLDPETMFSVPLIETGSAADRLRLMVQRYLQDTLAREAERQLMDIVGSIEDEKKTAADGSIITNGRSDGRKRANKRKKKSRKKRKNTLQRIEEAPPSVDTSTKDEVDGNDIDYEELFPTSRALTNLSSSLPSKERNRNMIMALAIIDDVINAVFVKVGLPASTDEEKGLSEDVKSGKRASTMAKIPEKATSSTKSRRGGLHEGKNGKVENRAPQMECASPVPSGGVRMNASDAFREGKGAPSIPAQSPLRTGSIDGSSISMLSFNSNQYHQQPQSPHSHVFSFMGDSHSSFSQHINYAHNSNLSIIDDATSPLGMSLNLGGAFDGWNGVRRYQSRDKSLFAEFFNKDDEQKDIDELLMAASTAASIASSYANDDEESDIQRASIASSCANDEESDIQQGEEARPEKDSGSLLDDDFKSVTNTDVDDEEDDVDDRSSITTQVTEPGLPPSCEREESSETDEQVAENSLTKKPNDMASSDLQSAQSTPQRDSLTSKAERDQSPLPQSPEPSEPPTPPPQLSPIQVSLADLGKLCKRKTSEELSKEFEKAISNKCTSPNLVAGSLPSSPKLDSSKRTWSRDDLRLSSFNDDQLLRKKLRGGSRQFDQAMSYRNAVTKSLQKASSTCSYEGRSGESAESRRTEKQKQVASDIIRSGLNIPLVPDLSTEANEAMIKGGYHVNACARSETAIEAHEDSSHLNVTERAPHHDESDNVTTTRDGATTISSGHSPPEAEEVTVLREERNAFRDLCLTLGAEVAKLKNMIAAQEHNPVYHPQAMQYSSPAPTIQPYYYENSSYHPEFTFFPPQGSNRTYAAMSDAGIHQDAAISEDGTDCVQGTDMSGMPWSGHPNSVIHTRRPSIGGNRTLSDAASIDYAPGCPAAPMSGFRSSAQRDALGGPPSHGIESRLSQDIHNFMDSISSQLKKRESRRMAATKRLTRLVTALWPRAQVKLYGSHVSNLCLPSSDLDFVICLPSVHKIDVAVAPGALEGRNAINETNQKVLARKLKGESWIDPRSIKIIERTAVPVIKVSTKDKRSRVLQLDISFDGPDHHGLEAIQMVQDVIKEFPMVRPLMLVLKQFLLDRSLLTAYTGGLSSYGLFLMVTRYLQEQAPSWGDAGSLLMGFLDFYGNHFDPRQTGISVRRSQYFSRPYYAQQTQHDLQQQMWNAPPPLGPSLGGKNDFPDLSRRHSFSEAARGGGSGINAMNNSPPKLGTKPPRFQAKRSSSHHSFDQEQQIPPHAQQHQQQQQQQQQQQHHHHHQQQQQQHHQQVPSSINVARPYTFDPLMAEDPLNAGNNIGRNTFRIFQVQRAFSDAHRALVASLEWDMNSTAGLNDGGDYPLLKSLLHNEDVFFESDSARVPPPS